MKKLIAVLAALLILSASLGALAVPAPVQDSLGPFSFEAPAIWEREQHDENGLIVLSYAGPAESLLTISYTELSAPLGSSAELTLSYIGIISGMGLKSAHTEPLTIGGTPAMLWYGDHPVQDQRTVPAAGVLYARGADVLSVVLFAPNKSQDNRVDFVRDFSTSITYTGTAADEPVEDEPAADEPVPASSEIDLSGMSYDELVALKDQINLAMWNSEEWQEVEVPTGVYIVGEDIPAGHWTIRAASEREYFFVSIFNVADEIGTGPARGATYESWEISAEGKTAFGDKVPTEASIELKEGWYFKTSGYALFTPYTGKPSLGFR